MISLFESSTCFEQLYAHPLRDSNACTYILHVGYSESKYRLRISLAHPRDCPFAHVRYIFIEEIVRQVCPENIKCKFIVSTVIGSFPGTTRAREPGTACV
jgi:hypothetical protein